MEPIQFTGVFDPNEFTKGMDAMIASLEKARAKELEVGKAIELTDEARKDSAEGIKKLTEQIAALDKTSKDYEKTNATLASRLKAVQGQFDKDSQTIEKERKEIDLLRASITKMETSYASATKAMDNLQKTAGKPVAVAINDTKITQQIGGIVDKAKGAGQVIAGSFNASASAVENVTNSVSSLGSLWGPLGLAAGSALAIIVKGLYDIAAAETEAEKTKKLLSDITLEANKAAAEETLTLKVLYNATQDVTLSIDQRTAAAKFLQDTYPKTFENFTTEEILLGKAKDGYDELTKAIYRNALATAAKGKLVEIENQKLDLLTKLKDKETKIQADISATEGTKTDEQIAKENNLSTQRQIDQFRRNAKTLANARIQQGKEIEEDYFKEIQKLTKRQQDIIDFVGEGNLLDILIKPGKTTKEKAGSAGREIVNIYEQELQKIKADIAALDKKEFTDDNTITKSVEEAFKKRRLALDKAFKAGQLTRPQLNNLKDNLSDLQQLTLEKDLKEFGERRAAFTKKIGDSITNIQAEENLKRISLIKDDFERQRQTIEVESQKTIDAAEQKRDKTISDFKANAARNGFTLDQIAPQIKQITDAYSKLLEDLENIKQVKLQKLSFDTFEKLAADANRTFNDQDVRLSTAGSQKIKTQTDLFLQGQITYKNYQKALTKIAREEADVRFAIERDRLVLQIRLREARLVTDKTLTDDQVKQLQDEINSLKKQLASITSGNNKDNAANKDADIKAKVAQLNQYVGAISNLINEVVAFWQAVNDAESKALDRSIELQQKRVDAAKVIAERGNAEYLRLEEDRLKDLEVKRENNARRQMAVNAALQASQVLTALISGIAYGAQQGGAIGAIAGLAAIIAAIAGGYAIVKSLEPQQPSFFVGTEDTGPGGKKDNKGGFQATLHPHERVMTADQNKKLHIQGRKLTNEELVTLVTKTNHFIEHNYPSKPIPQHNIAAIEMASDVNNTGSIKIAGIMEENNRKLDKTLEWQEKIHHSLKHMGVNVLLDRNGFAASVYEVIDQMEKDKRA